MARKTKNGFNINILEWKTAKPSEERLAKKVSKKLQLGDIYFRYNVPLQVWISYKKENDPKSGIDLKKSRMLNYMPRKECSMFESLSDVFDMSQNIAVKDIKDFMAVAGIILANLAAQFKKFKPLDSDNNYVYYPNTRH